MSSDTKVMGAIDLKNRFKPELGNVSNEMGRADTLRYNVLTFVVEENYERAIQELKAFLDGDSEYPKLRERVERYVGHAVDLVHAIRAKRKFPGMQLLTAAKQKELNEKFAGHFHELTIILKKLERVQYELKVEDVRSTVWVVQAFAYSIFAICLVAFLLDVNHGLLKTAIHVFDDLFFRLTTWIFTKI